MSAHGVGGRAHETIDSRLSENRLSKPAGCSPAGAGPAGCRDAGDGQWRCTRPPVRIETLRQRQPLPGRGRAASRRRHATTTGTRMPAPRPRPQAPTARGLATTRNADAAALAHGVQPLAEPCGVRDVLDGREPSPGPLEVRSLGDAGGHTLGLVGSQPAQPRIALRGMAAPTSVVDTVVSLCKRRGFVFPCGEIYGGTRSAWDYGPLGVELKENIKRQWWRSMVTSPRGRRRARLLDHPAAPDLGRLGPRRRVHRPAHRVPELPQALPRRPHAGGRRRPRGQEGQGGRPRLGRRSPTSPAPTAAPAASGPSRATST